MHRESGAQNPFHTSLFLRQLPARVSLGELLAHGLRYPELRVARLRGEHRAALGLRDGRVSGHLLPRLPDLSSSATLRAGEHLPVPPWALDLSLTLTARTLLAAAAHEAGIQRHPPESTAHPSDSSEPSF